MERFNLSRYDLMRMSWTELTMLFDATYDGPDDQSAEPKEVARMATMQDVMNWI